MRRTFIALLTIAALATPAAALAGVPENDVTGVANSQNWFSGSLIQQPGLNCSTAILGEPYTEIMVSGIAAYGGAPGNGVVKVGDGYWTSFLIAVVGNPCGSGSSGIQTELVLPPNTQVDITGGSRRIRCFGTPRGSNTWIDLTDGNWNAFGSSGRYCPTAPGPAFYNPGSLSFGFRPLASGQLFQIFVPVKSTGQLFGAGANPADGFRWLTNATGVYANPGLSTVWANVFPAGSGGGPGNQPFVYFSKPGALPFWKANPTPAGTENRVELYANLYTAGLGGSFCPTLTRTDTSQVLASCNDFKTSLSWNDVIPSGGSLISVVSTSGQPGPNGGYTIGFAGAEYLNVPMRIRWDFDPSPPGAPVYSGSYDFRTLAGPDTDGDGVPDASDACASTKGTLANGCLPTPQADPDKDGIYGENDKCPGTDGQGAANGCPGGVVPAAPVPPGPTPGPVLPGAIGGRLAVKKGAKLKRSGLVKGLVVPVTCTRDAAATLTLQVTKKVARTLKLKAKGTTLPLATGKGACTAARGAKLKLKPGRAVGARLKKVRRAFAASLVLRLTAADKGTTTVTVPVKVG